MSASSHSCLMSELIYSQENRVLHKWWLTHGEQSSVSSNYTKDDKSDVSVYQLLDGTRLDPGTKYRTDCCMWRTFLDESRPLLFYPLIYLFLVTLEYRTSQSHKHVQAQSCHGRRWKMRVKACGGRRGQHSGGWERASINPQTWLENEEQVSEWVWEVSWILIS